MAAPIGANVGLYMDCDARLFEGDHIVTESGRRYLVTAVRVQERGMRAGRQHLRCTVIPPDQLPDPDAKVQQLRWYRR